VAAGTKTRQKHTLKRTLGTQSRVSCDAVSLLAAKFHIDPLPAREVCEAPENPASHVLRALTPLSTPARESANQHQ
jgi:hypothetical protein